MYFDNFFNKEPLPYTYEKCNFKTLNKIKENFSTSDITSLKDLDKYIENNENNYKLYLKKFLSSADSKYYLSSVMLEAKKNDIIDSVDNIELNNLIEKWHIPDFFKGKLKKNLDLNIEYVKKKKKSISDKLKIKKKKKIGWSCSFILFICLVFIFSNEDIDNKIKNIVIIFITIVLIALSIILTLIRVKKWEKKLIETIRNNIIDDNIENYYKKEFKLKDEFEGKNISSTSFKAELYNRKKEGFYLNIIDHRYISKTEYFIASLKVNDGNLKDNKYIYYLDGTSEKNDNISITTPNFNFKNCTFILNNINLIINSVCILQPETRLILVNNSQITINNTLKLYHPFIKFHLIQNKSDSDDSSGITINKGVHQGKIIFQQNYEKVSPITIKETEIKPRPATKLYIHIRNAIDEGDNKIKLKKSKYDNEIILTDISGDGKKYTPKQLFDKDEIIHYNNLSNEKQYYVINETILYIDKANTNYKNEDKFFKILNTRSITTTNASVTTITTNQPYNEEIIYNEHTSNSLKKYKPSDLYGTDTNQYFKVLNPPLESNTEYLKILL